MNRRELLLAVAAGLLGLAYLGTWYAREKVMEPLNQRTADLEQLEADRLLRLKGLADIARAEREMADLRRRGLAAEAGVAGSGYQQFLVKLFAKAGFSDKAIAISAQPAVTGVAKDVYRLPFSVKAEGSLAGLMRFLYLFHASDMMHVVRTVHVEPVIKDDKLKEFALSLEIDALLFRDQAARGPLPDVAAVAKAAEAKGVPKRFAERNVFQPTKLVAKERAVASAEPKRDERADYTVTGITESGTPEVLLTNDKSKKVMRVADGGKLSIPGMEGTVAGFDFVEHLVLFKVGDKTGAVRLGKTLATFKELPPRTARMADGS